MKKYIKKFTACFLIISIIVSSFIFSKATTSDADKPSKVLLESMLNNRSWVLDTIVHGDYSSHPFMYSQNFDDYTYPIFQRVQEDPCLGSLVTICEYILNEPLDTVLDHIKGLSLTTLETILKACSLVVPDEYLGNQDYMGETLLDTLLDSYDTKLEKHYEYVFNGMFTAEYESEFQVSLSEEEFRISNYRTQVDHLKDVSDAITDIKKTCNAAGSILDSLKMEYAETFLGDYKLTLNNYFEYRSKYTKNAKMTDRSNLVNSIYSASLTQQSQFGVFDNNSAEFEGWRNNYQVNKFMGKAKKVISGAGSFVDFTSSMISNCLLLESLQYQKENTLGGLRSLYHSVDNIGVKDIVDDYIDLIDGTYDDVTVNLKMGFDSFFNTNITQDVIKDGIVKFGSSHLSNYVSLATSKLVSSAVVSFNTSVIVGELITGALKTSEKFFQVKSAMSLIEAMKDAYATDLAKYRSNKTEENASQVINDLLLLKKLRLFTCQMIYDSARHQIGTPIGAVLTGINIDEGDYFLEDMEYVLTNWETMYQDQIDILHSATLDPISTAPFTLEAGDQLYVDVTKNYGILKRNNKNYILCEIAERLLGGLIMDNASVNFYTLSDGDEFFVSTIFSSGDCLIETSGVSLTVMGLYHEGEELKIRNSHDMTFLSDFEVINSKFDHLGTGRMVMKGNMSVDDGDIIDLLITGGQDQTIKTVESLWVDDLEFDKTAGVVTVPGVIDVSESLKNPSTTVKAGNHLRLRFGGILIGTHCEGDVALECHSFDNTMTFGGNLYTYNQTKFNSSLKVEEVFLHTGSLLKIGGYAQTGDFNVDGRNDSVVSVGGNIISNEDICINNSAFAINGTQKAIKDIAYISSDVNATLLDAGEDIYISNSYCEFTDDLNAGVEVYINNSEISAPNITSAELTEINESVFDVTEKSTSGNLKVTDSTVNASKAETNGDAVVKNSQYTIENNQTIAGNLQAEGGLLNIPVVSVENDIILKSTELISSDNITSKGSFTSHSSNLQSKNTFVNGDLHLNKSTFNVNDVLTLRGDYSSNGSTINIKNMVIDGYTTQIIEGQELCLETLTIKNLSSQGTIVNSDVLVSGLLSNPYGKISGNVYVTALEGCTVENGKYNGSLTLAEASWAADKYNISGNLKTNGNTSLDADSITVGGNIIYDGTSSDPTSTGTLTVNATDIDIGSFDQKSGAVIIDAKNIICDSNFVHQNLNLTASEMTVKGVLEQLSGTAEYNLNGLVVESDFKQKGTSEYNISELVVGSDIIQQGTAEYNVSKITVEHDFVQKGNSELNVTEFIIKSDFLQQGSVTNNGKIIVEGEAAISGIHVGEDLEIKQSVNVGNGVDVQSLTLSGKLQQIITGVSAKTVDLYFENSSKDGIAVYCPINVSGEFFNNTKNIDGISNIKIGTLNSCDTQIEGDFNIGNWTCTENTVISGDLNISGTVTVNPGVTLTVGGILNNSSEIVLNGATLIKKESVNNNGSITLTDSSCLMIDDSAYFKSGTVTIDGTSELIVTEDSFVTSTVENSGKIKFNDIYFKSGTVKGSGTYEFCGDVRSDGATFEKINVIFNSKLKQSVIGKEFNFNNVTVNNSSKDGLVNDAVVNCYGILEKGNSVIKNPEKLVSKGV